MKIVNVTNSMLHVPVKLNVRDNVLVVSNDFLPHHAAILMPINPNGEHSVHTPDDEHWQIKDMGQPVSDLSNVVNGVPDSSKHVQGHGQ